MTMPQFPLAALLAILFFASLIKSETTCDDETTTSTPNISTTAGLGASLGVVTIASAVVIFYLVRRIKALETARQQAGIGTDREFIGTTEMESQTPTRRIPHRRWPSWHCPNEERTEQSACDDQVPIPGIDWQRVQIVRPAPAFHQLEHHDEDHPPPAEMPGPSRPFELDATSTVAGARLKRKTLEPGPGSSQDDHCAETHNGHNDYPGDYGPDTMTTMTISATARGRIPGRHHEMQEKETAPGLGIGRWYRGSGSESEDVVPWS